MFLEDINCMLNSGEVPDLFDGEEIDNIVMDLKPAAGEASIPDTRQAVFQFFISVRKTWRHNDVFLICSQKFKPSNSYWLVFFYLSMIVISTMNFFPENFMK